MLYPNDPPPVHDPSDPSDPGISQYAWRHYMSQDMLNQLLPIHELIEEVEFCHRKVWQARDAADDFPGTAVNGTPMRAGAATQDMAAISYYWICRRDAAIQLLPRNREINDWVDALGCSNIVYGKPGKRPPERID